MRSFTQILNEAIASNAFKDAGELIQMYLQNNIAKNCFRSPGVEEVNGANGSYTGVRYLFPKKNMSVRFNWKSTPSGSMAPNSVDIYIASATPTLHVTFDGNNVSLVKILPFVVNVLKDPATYRSKKFLTILEDVELVERMYTGDVAFDKDEATQFRWSSDKSRDAYVKRLKQKFEDSIFEVEDDYLKADGKYLATKPTFEDLQIVNESNNEDIFDSVLGFLSQGDFKISDIKKIWGLQGKKLYKAIKEQYPQYFEKAGRSFNFIGGESALTEIRTRRDDILNNAGATRVNITKGGGEHVTHSMDAQAKQLEDDQERLTFEEQLDDMERLVKMTISGASNALFVAGRGGVGKTHGVEKVLSSVGLNDGNGYFKNTGSSSAAGLYSLLFRYSDSILLFDDSDDTLGDQTSRNLIKAATDTKPRRKLNWAKRGSNVVEPDEYESHDELLDDGKIPRYFYFTGKIIFISNLNPDRLDPDGALRTRSFLIDINPTDAEIYDFMEKIVDKVDLPDGLSLATEDRKHVVTLLKQGKSKQTANLRKLVRGLSMYAGAKAAGTSVSDQEMNRMIAMYA